MAALIDDGSGIVGRLKSVLVSKGLTLHQVSQESARLYRDSAAHRIPHNFYNALARSSRFAPSLQQLCAFSRILGYRLDDWLTLFGIELDQIPRLQALLPAKRTLIVDSSLDSADQSTPWFWDAPDRPMRPGIVPLGWLIEMPPANRRTNVVAATDRSEFLYAKIGMEDALAFPDLLPGSVVRVTPAAAEGLPPSTTGRLSDSIFLVEHGNGFFCSRLHFSTKSRIYPVSKYLAYAQVGFQLSKEARILGVVDMEIRWLAQFVEPSVPTEFARHWRPQDLSQGGGGLGHFLRRARTRTGLSFREASALSKRVSMVLGDDRYFAAQASLSDYEAQHSPPRQIQKILTLCILYGVSFSGFLREAGANEDELGKQAIPRNLMPSRRHATQAEARSISPDTGNEYAIHNPKASELITTFGDLPQFLRESLAELSEMRNISLRDFFWVGPSSDLMIPEARGAVLILVNRHKQKPTRFRSKPPWQQPLYIIRKRDGTYVCTCCSLENDTLILYPEAHEMRRPIELVNRRDAEVVGQVVAIARLL